jgi:hypothetical protein
MYAALFRNHVQKSNATVPIRLPDHVQVTRRLVADPAAVDRDAGLLGVKSEEALRDFQAQRQTGA